VLLNAPAGVRVALPAGVTLEDPGWASRADVALAFLHGAIAPPSSRDCARRDGLPGGGTWVAWPKRSSGVPTDLTDDEVRTVLLPLGLVDNKVCAIDAPGAPFGSCGARSGAPPPFPIPLKCGEVVRL